MILNCLLLVVIMNLASNTLGRGAKPRHKQSVFLDTDMESKLEFDSSKTIQEHSSKYKVQCQMTNYQRWTAPKIQEYISERCKKFKVLSSRGGASSEILVRLKGGGVYFFGLIFIADLGDLRT